MKRRKIKPKEHRNNSERRKKIIKFDIFELCCVVGGLLPPYNFAQIARQFFHLSRSRVPRQNKPGMIVDMRIISLRTQHNFSCSTRFNINFADSVLLLFFGNFGESCKIMFSHLNTNDHFARRFVVSALMCFLYYIFRIRNGLKEASTVEKVAFIAENCIINAYILIFSFIEHS